MRTPSLELREASNRGDLDKIIHWLENGAEINAGDVEGWTPLLLAIHGGYPIAAMTLIEHGANANVMTQGGDTPLHWSSFHGQYHVSLALIDKGANTNARNQFGATPLHAACRYGRHEVVSLLILRGANVHIKTKKDRRTPLHLASFHNFKDVVDILLTNGADCRVTSSDGKTALDLAMVNGHWSTAAVLRDAEEKILNSERDRLFQQNSEFGKKWFQLTERVMKLQSRVIDIEKQLGGGGKANVESQERLRKELPKMKSDNAEPEAKDLERRLKTLELETMGKGSKLREDFEVQMSNLNSRIKSLEKRVSQEDKYSIETDFEPPSKEMTFTTSRKDGEDCIEPSLPSAIGNDAQCNHELESSMSNDELLNSGEWKLGKTRKNRRNRRR